MQTYDHGVIPLHACARCGRRWPSVAALVLHSHRCEVGRDPSTVSAKLARTRE